MKAKLLKLESMLMKKENGISHFIEHMIFKGTEHRSGVQIAKELDAIGGFSNAFTGKENTCFYSKALNKDFETKLTNEPPLL